MRKSHAKLFDSWRVHKCCIVALHRDAKRRHVSLVLYWHLIRDSSEPVLDFSRPSFADISSCCRAADWYFVSLDGQVLAVGLQFCCDNSYRIFATCSHGVQNHCRKVDCSRHVLLFYRAQHRDSKGGPAPPVAVFVYVLWTLRRLHVFSYDWSVYVFALPNRYMPVRLIMCVVACTCSALDFRVLCMLIYQT